MAKELKPVGKVLFTEEQIRQRAKEIGEQITKEFKGEPVIILGTLKGSTPWLADVFKNINLEAYLDFIKASSYGSSTMSSGVVKISYEPTSNMYNQNVIIIEDIVDTGNTLAYVFKKLEERHPKTVKVCTMLNKPSRRTADVTPDYVGFDVDDLFIIGYGLDFDEKYRNLPYISYLTESDVEAL